ncbi:nuclear transport factor 2 family protein [Winogradskyella litorisediminis]|uniref:Nuclear transport factor 2 family protein n=1 Tax=Winogradskyella litorisediminis TaxID=1156618 RepID=A0ABW3N1R7_9FLAO
MDALLHKFYLAFKNLDADTMIECYHDDILFKDPAFGVLKAERAKNMWRMLCNTQKGKDFKVSYSNIKTNNEKGYANWQAEYLFSKTGRRVINSISSEFQFKDGLIIKHTDSFDLHNWAKQAFGFKGWLIGNTSFFENKLQKQTNKILDIFESKNI